MKNYIGREGVLKSIASALVLDIQQLTLWKKRELKPASEPDLRIGFVPKSGVHKGSSALWKTAVEKRLL